MQKIISARAELPYLPLENVRIVVRNTYVHIILYELIFRPKIFVLVTIHTLLMRFLRKIDMIVLRDFLNNLLHVGMTTLQ